MKPLPRFYRNTRAGPERPVTTQFTPPRVSGTSVCQRTEHINSYLDLNCELPSLARNLGTGDWECGGSGKHSGTLRFPTDDTADQGTLFSFFLPTAAAFKGLPGCTPWACWRLALRLELLWRNSSVLAHRWHLFQSKTSRNHWPTPAKAGHRVQARSEETTELPVFNSMIRNRFKCQIW